MRGQRTKPLGFKSLAHKAVRTRFISVLLRLLGHAQNDPGPPALFPSPQRATSSRHPFEGHDLISIFGDAYRQYRPARTMLVPVRQAPKIIQRQDDSVARFSLTCANSLI